MFRILENNDGTTSIFCKNSGNLVCTIPTKGSACSHRPVNVVEPQLADEPPSSDSWVKRTQNKEPEQEETNESSSTSVSLCSLPLVRDEDYRLESASQAQFAKCLGLVSQEEMHSSPLSQLLAEWPLRLLSRSVTFRGAENTLLKDLKVPDQLPLTSSLGVRLLRLNEARHFPSPDRLSQSLRSYDSFCRHPYNTACPSACHFPKLRCRGEKAYPVTTPSRIHRHLHTAHVYSRGWRQREERRITLRTGLDAKSRRLLRRCNTRRLTVDIVRIPQSEIDDWLSRVTTIDIVTSDDEDSDPECYVPRPRLPPRNRDMTCSVRLRNVTMDIQRRGSAYYVRNTNIKVPFYKDFLSSLTVDQFFHNVCPTTGKPQRNPKGPKTKSQQSLKLKLPPQQSHKPKLPPIKQTFATVKLGPPPVATKALLPASNKPIVCIDLTEESPPRKTPPPVNKCLVISGQKVIVNSGRQGNTRQPKLVGYDSRQVSVNAHCSGAVSDGRQHPSMVNGRSHALNDHLVIVNNGRSSKVRAVAESVTITNRCSRQVVSNHSGESEVLTSVRSITSTITSTTTISNRRSRQVVANHSDEHQVLAGRRPRELSITKVPTRRSLVSPKSSFALSKFHCFACGLERNYFDQANSLPVERAVREHLTNFHATSNADAFLSKYVDNVNHCTVIEAFPGYKEV